MIRNLRICNRTNIRPKWACFYLWLALVIGCIGTPNVSAEPKTLRDWLDQGWGYYNQGKIDDAFNTFLQTVEKYPDEAEAHLVLGWIYLDKGVTSLGRKELTRSLQLDDFSENAARAHYELGLSFREEDTALALDHLNRCMELKGSPSLQMEASHQIRFCKLLIRLCGRSESGSVILHYSPDLIDLATADALAKKTEGALYLVETFCAFKLTKQVHLFLYPTTDDIHVDIWDSRDYIDPVHREFHLVYTPSLDVFPYVSRQVITDLLRKARMKIDDGAWVYDVLPVAVTGDVHIIDANGEDNGKEIDCDEAVKALSAQDKFVKLSYLVNPELADDVSPEVRLAELGSFLRWVRATYSADQLQRIITLGDIGIVLKAETDVVQNEWLTYVSKSKSLITNPKSASDWATKAPASILVEGADQPEDMVKKGLDMYLSGDTTNGKMEIHRVVNTYPGIGLGYYTLGWIACRESDWAEAEKQLTMAEMLFEKPEEIAWCYAYLAPIYLRESRRDLAKAALNIVISTIDNPDIRQWAGGLQARLSHLSTLEPVVPVSRESVEFGEARDFVAEWNKGANSGRDLKSMIQKDMDITRYTALSTFYSSVKKDYPSVMFNHALQAAMISGSDLLIEVRIQAVFKEKPGSLPVEMEDLANAGRLRYFRIAKMKKAWVVTDWEDEPYAGESMRFLMSINPGMGSLKNKVPFGGASGQ
jgi:tetratricopeptide (TPR) repeat protein